MEKIQNLAHGKENKVTYVDLGKELYKSLIRSDTDIYGHFRYSLYDPIAYQNTNPNDRLRIILEIDDPYFQSLPWEVLHDGNAFVSIHNNVSVTRKPSTFGGVPIKEIEDTLKVLIILSNPHGTEVLDYASIEKNAIIETFKERLGENRAEIHILSTELGNMEKTVTDKRLKGITMTP